MKYTLQINIFFELKLSLSNLANFDWLTYKPTKNTFKKHGILKRPWSNKDIVITRSDKGSDGVILDKACYEEKISKLINDVNKFKKLNQDPTLTREEQLQYFLMKN